VRKYSQPFFDSELLVQKGYDKNRGFRPISRFISETTQDMVTVTIEDE